MLKKFFNWLSNHIHGKAHQMAAETEQEQEPQRIRGKIYPKTITENTSYLFQCIDIITEIEQHTREICDRYELTDIELDYFDEVKSQLQATIIQLTAKKQ